MKSEIDSALNSLVSGEKVIATSEQMMLEMDEGGESLLPLVVYHPRAKRYWKQLKKMKGGKSKAVQDYIDYVGGKKSAQTVPPKQHTKEELETFKNILKKQKQVPGHEPSKKFKDILREKARTRGKS